MLVEKGKLVGGPFEDERRACIHTLKRLLRRLDKNLCLLVRALRDPSFLMEATIVSCIEKALGTIL